MPHTTKNWNITNFIKTRYSRLWITFNCSVTRWKVCGVSLSLIIPSTWEHLLCQSSPAWLRPPPPHQRRANGRLSRIPQLWQIGWLDLCVLIRPLTGCVHTDSLPDEITARRKCFNLNLNRWLSVLTKATLQIQRSGQTFVRKQLPTLQTNKPVGVLAEWLRQIT